MIQGGKEGGEHNGLSCWVVGGKKKVKRKREKAWGGVKGLAKTIQKGMHPKPGGPAFGGILIKVIKGMIERGVLRTHGGRNDV